MRALGLTRSSLILAAVLVPYWLPAIVALRYGIYYGGDPIEIGLALGRYWTDLPGAALGPVVTPLLLAGFVTATWTVLRAKRAGRRVDDPVLWSAVVLGLPHVLLLLYFGAVVLLYLIVCGNGGCW